MGQRTPATVNFFVDRKRSAGEQKAKRAALYLAGAAHLAATGLSYSGLPFMSGINKKTDKLVKSVASMTCDDITFERFTFKENKEGVLEKDNNTVDKNNDAYTSVKVHLQTMLQHGPPQEKPILEEGRGEQPRQRPGAAAS